jgi:mercuric ion transport protein
MPMGPFPMHTGGGIEMTEQTSRPSKKGFYAALTGTIIVALCFFTPLLVITLGAVGLSAFTPYLDYVLFPALGIMILTASISYRRWKKARIG